MVIMASLTFNFNYGNPYLLSSANELFYGKTRHGRTRHARAKCRKVAVAGRICAMGKITFANNKTKRAWSLF